MLRIIALAAEKKPHHKPDEKERLDELGQNVSRDDILFCFIMTAS